MGFHTLPLLSTKKIHFTCIYVYVFSIQVKKLQLKSLDSHPITSPPRCPSIVPGRKWCISMIFFYAFALQN